MAISATSGRASDVGQTPAPSSVHNLIHLNSATPTYKFFSSRIAESFGRQGFGSRVVPHSVTNDTDGGEVSNTMSISAMPVYNSKSPEELRWEDYEANDKGGPDPATQQGQLSNSGCTGSDFSILDPPTNIGLSYPFGSTIFSLQSRSAGSSLDTPTSQGSCVSTSTVEFASKPTFIKKNVKSGVTYRARTKLTDLSDSRSPSPTGHPSSTSPSSQVSQPAREYSGSSSDSDGAERKSRRTPMENGAVVESRRRLRDRDGALLESNGRRMRMTDEGINMSPSRASMVRRQRHRQLGPECKGRRLDTEFKGFVTVLDVKCPILIDESPHLIPSKDQNRCTRTYVNSIITTPPCKAVADPGYFNNASVIKFDGRYSGLVNSVSLHSQVTRELSPPPVAADVQYVQPPSHSHDSQVDISDVLRSRIPKAMHISVRLMEVFTSFAEANTKADLETCGVLAGSIKEGVFYVTTLIIPKQVATYETCSTTDEEDIFDYQMKHDLSQFGWIHTHPSQTCFMSSVDLHTHFSYQVMLPEAVAIVLAPTDPRKKFGIFRLAEPCGIKVIRACDMRGFHPHEMPEDGRAVYEECGHVVLDPGLDCKVVDFRPQVKSCQS